MTFPVAIIYLNRSYTYDVETTDGIHFTCRCRLSGPLEEFGTPPELIELDKEKELKLDKIAAYRVQLHTDLMAGIDKFIREA